MTQLVPAGIFLCQASAAGEGGGARPRTTPEKRASDLAEVAASEEYKRLSRKYPRLRTDEVWELVGKSDDEIDEMMR